MHIVAGTFKSTQEAQSAFVDLNKQGIAPIRMKLIQGDDKKGFERQHRPTRTASLRGACAGAIFGVAIFGMLLFIAGVNLLELRYMALYLSGIALCTGGGAVILAFLNMGASHDEALLYEEAKEEKVVIAAVEVDDPMEKDVMQELEKHGARNVRSGNWQPAGWHHVNPVYETPA